MKGTNSLSRKAISMALAMMILLFNLPMSSVLAAVETADFEGLGYADGIVIADGAVVEGFQFVNSKGSGMMFSTQYGANPGPCAIVANYSGPIEWVDFTRSNNSDFDLTSLWYNAETFSGDNQYTFTGYLDGNATAKVTKVVSISGKNTITFTSPGIDDGWRQVDRVRITATGTLTHDVAAFIDNIVYEETNVSSDPFLSINNAITVTEGANVTVTSSFLKAADNDSPSANTLRFTITTGAAHGRVELSTSPGTAITTFTQEDINNNIVRYVHDHTDTKTDSFGFKISDGTNELTGQTFQINVTPVYDRPLPAGYTRSTFDGLQYTNGQIIPNTTEIEKFVFETSSNQGMQYMHSGGEDNTSVLVAAGNIPITSVTIRRSDSSNFNLHSMYIFDSAAPDASTYTIQGYRDGTAIYSLTNLKPNSLGYYEYKWADIDEIRVTATGTSTDIWGRFDNITYQDIALSPIPFVEINNGLTVDEGKTETIANTALKSSDNDSVVSALAYNVTTAPTHGRLENLNQPGTAITTFTQGDIDNGKIRYVHDHSDTLSDSFGFSVSDGTNVLSGQIFPITVTPVYDDAIPVGYTVATFDDLAGTYTHGQDIPYTTAINGFVFRPSGNLGMKYLSSGGQDNTPTLQTSGNIPVTSLSIKKSDGVDFNLSSMFLYDASSGAGSPTYTITGYNNNSPVSGYTKTGVNVKSPNKVLFNWMGIDEIRIIPEGTNADILANFDNIVYQNSNLAPVASDVAISGTLTYGEELTGSYTYQDADADAQGISTLQWYRADNNTGLNRTPISGAEGLTYTLTSSDVGKYIGFGVIPEAATGTTPGSEGIVYSSSSVAKAASKITTAPTASAITYGQSLADSTLTGGTGSVPGSFSWTTPSTKPSVSDSGVTAYSVTFTPTDSSIYATSTTIVTLVVNKATPSILTVPTASALTYGHWLVDSTLTGGVASTTGTFSWQNDVFLKVSDSQTTDFGVVFTPADPANYKSVTLSVRLTVNKADPIITQAPTVSAITYGDTLSDSTITGDAAYPSGSYSWADPTIRPSVSDSGVTDYTVIFTANDSANYNTATTTVKIVVNKATPVITTPPDGSAIAVGQALSSSVLTGGTADTEGTFVWSNPLTVPSIADSQVTDYGVTFLPTDSDNYTTATTKILITVNKAAPIITTIPTASSITFGETLSDSTLSGGTASVPGTFSWTDGSIEPSVSDSGTTQFSVTFTPTDEINYSTVVMTVTLIVEKQTPIILTAPSASAITYGDTLADSTLTGGIANIPGSFSWMTSTTTPSVADSDLTLYSVTFTPTDSINFSSVTLSLTLTVEKATPDIYVTPSGSSITYGDDLSASILTGGTASVAGSFGWTDPTVKPFATDSGVTQFSITFTPSDTANYTDATATITLTIAKATPSIITAPTASAITYGEALSDSILTGGSASVPGAFAWTSGATEPTVSDSDTTPYSVTFTPSDSDNYQTASTSVTLAVSKANPTISTMPVASDITYGDTLANSLLSGGVASTSGSFSWSDDSISPSVSDSGVTGYEVIFTPDDIANYNTTNINITLIVSKATPFISVDPAASTITYGDTLSDSTLSGGLVSDPGTFTWTDGSLIPAVSDSDLTLYSVTFTPKDSENFATVTTSITITVLKATPVIAVDPTASAITYGESLLDSTLSGGSADVPGDFAWSDDTIMPSVADSGITTYPVIFTPTDTANYNTVTLHLTLTVQKATPTINTNPTASAIVYGQTLADSLLIGGDASVPGTFAWSIGTQQPGMTDSGTTQYEITFTPDDNGNYASVTTQATLIVNKASAAAPISPVVSSKTDVSVTLQEVTGYEYLRVADGADLSTGVWQDSPVFTGLTYFTAYDFYQRIKETDTHHASVISAKLDVTTEVPALVGTANISGNAVYGQTLTASFSGSCLGTLSYQWIRDGADIDLATASNYTLTVADIGHQIQVRISSSFESGSVTGTLTQLIQKMNAPSPTVPVLSATTQSSVSLVYIAGYEYMKVEKGAAATSGTWQDSNIFGGLLSSTGYDFYQRIKETATSKASEISSVLTVTTNAAPTPTATPTPTPSPTPTVKPTVTPTPTTPTTTETTVTSETTAGTSAETSGSTETTDASSPTTTEATTETQTETTSPAVATETSGASGTDSQNGNNAGMILLFWILGGVFAAGILVFLGFLLFKRKR